MASQSCCQESSWTVELVVHTYDGRRVARHTQLTTRPSTATSISCAFAVDLVPTIVQQLTRFWYLIYCSASCSLSAVEELFGYLLLGINIKNSALFEDLVLIHYCHGNNNTTRHANSFMRHIYMSLKSPVAVQPASKRQKREWNSSKCIYAG